MRGLTISKLLVYIMMTVGAILSLFPFYWMFVMATNSKEAINQSPPAFIPGDQLVVNFVNVLQQIRFFEALANSFIVSTLVTLGVLFLCSLAGFAFAKMEFPGKNVLFVAILVTMMVPTQLGLVPSYFIITKLGWLNDMKALVVPGLVNAFGIFWMRQYIKDTVPDEIIQAAKIDGCGNFRIYWNIVVPSILPAFATLGIVTFMQIWNDFLWPITVLRDPSFQTIQVAIRSLNDVYIRDYGMILSGTFWATVPLVIVFLIFNKFFISGLTQGSVK
jgi:cellobiose transport system permease protein